jgi:hypothetical protein
MGDPEDTPPQEATGGTSEDGCGHTAEPLDTDQAPVAVPPEADTTLTLPADPLDAVRRWPRYTFSRRRAGRVVVCLLNPLASGTARITPFTTEMFAEYLAAMEQPERSGRDRSTWGVPHPIELKVSRLERPEGGGASRLVFDDATAFPITVYNLDPSQPAWERILRRTLAIVPIEHLTEIGLRSVFLDFRVGTNRIGPRAPVGSGGTNWGSRATGIDPEGRPAICTTFAALNRAWGHHDRPASQLPANDDAIDAAFAEPGYLFDTFYHELAHRFTPGPNSLWDQYRRAINYDGESDGPGEGFSEAYRQRMSGRGFTTSPRSVRDPGPGASEAARARHELQRTNYEYGLAHLDEVRTRVAARFDELGMPSLESVRDAQAAIQAAV